MNCKKAQGLMLTDHIDGEMDIKAKETLRKHVEVCRECGEFSIAAKRVGNDLFAFADRANVPEYLWRRVRENILAEGAKRKNFAEAVLRKFRQILYIPKPALAVLTIMVLLLAIGTAATIGNRAAMNAEISTQAEYFDYLTGALSPDIVTNENATFGTAIEKYFM